MDIDIKEDAFLEYGEFNGNIYGTKLETIHSVIHSGKMCVLDVNPTVSILISISCSHCYYSFCDSFYIYSRSSSCYFMA